MLFNVLPTLLAILLVCGILCSIQLGVAR